MGKWEAGAAPAQPRCREAVRRLSLWVHFDCVPCFCKTAWWVGVWGGRGGARAAAGGAAAGWAQWRLPRRGGQQLHGALLPQAPLRWCAGMAVAAWVLHGMGAGSSSRLQQWQLKWRHHRVRQGRRRLGRQAGGANRMQAGLQGRRRMLRAPSSEQSGRQLGVEGAEPRQPSGCGCRGSMGGGEGLAHQQQQPCRQAAVDAAGQEPPRQPLLL